ncbi:MAG: SGNH/GDSL hydrolase family protein [Chthoniobacteraceae bacterium]
MLHPSHIHLLGLTVVSAFADDRPLTDKPADPYFAKYELLAAPATKELLLQKGDRLAICGDSITEQKMYSRIMETYLTVCVPELEVTARQYGWSGERAGGFLARMKQDVLAFSPTIATTCYGMNDHQYKPYEEAIGATYREKQTAIVEAFKAAGTRVVLGSAGTVGKMPHWVKSARGTVEDLNHNLSRLRTIGIEIANEQNVAFADVFLPMLTTGFQARQKHGPDFAVEGKDGVHPGWAGQTVMAYAFLKGLGLSGDIGTFTVDLGKTAATASEGHNVAGFADGKLAIKSTRYPFCAPEGDPTKDDTIAAGLTLVPFHQELNRLILIATNGSADSYEVKWGGDSKTYTAEELAKGVNLAADFPRNPFSEAFAKVDAAVAKKQAYETKQIKEVFHQLLAGRFKSAEEIKDPEMKELFALRDADGKLDREAVIRATEEKRAPLAAAIKDAFVPVEHTIEIQPAK